MLSEFRQLKMSSLFRIWDFDHDGYLERSEYVLVALRLAELAGLLPGSPDYQVLVNGYLAGWNHLKAQADADHDDRISLEEYLAVQAQDLQDKERWRTEVLALQHFVFTAVDSDHDEQLTQDEFAHIAQAYGLDEATSHEVSRRFDKDGDNLIPFTDLFEYLEDFYYGEDPQAIGRYIAGIFNLRDTDILGDEQKDSDESPDQPPDPPDEK